MTARASQRATADARLPDSPADLAAAFLYLHDLFRPPTYEQWAWLTAAPTRAFHARLAELMRLPAGERDLELPANASNYESEYIAAFDSGAPHAPVPLIESHYNRQTPVPKVLHENILFYQSFGLRLRSSANETSDHLRHQLEFVAHLLRLESAELAKLEEFDQREDAVAAGSESPAAIGVAAAAAAAGAASVAGAGLPSSRAEVEARLWQLRRAREEFLRRRMADWLPLAVRAAERLPWHWVGRALRLTHAVVQCA